MKKKIIVLMFSILYLSVLYGQNDPLNSLALTTPNAANLGRYGDLPVSYYTGSVDVSIPLHSLSSRGIDLPITLSYNTSGVRIADLPSSVGQNWTLNCGGVITRSVQGFPDDYNYASFQPVSSKFSNYFNSYNKLSADYYKGTEFNNLYVRDFEPDVFMFNFMGKTGKFYLGNDGQWKIDSDWNIDIIFDIKKVDNFSYPFIKNIPDLGASYEYTKSIKGFILRDDSGNTYTFGYNEEATECSISFFNQIGKDNGNVYPMWTTNSWYLTEVKDKYSNIIYQFEYKRGYFIANLEPSSYTSYIRSEFTWAGKRIVNGDFSRSSHRYGGNLLLPTYLKRVSDYQNQIEVTFDYTDNRDLVYYKNANLTSAIDGTSLFTPFFLTLIIPRNDGTGVIDGPIESIATQIRPYIYKGGDNNTIDIFKPMRNMAIRYLDRISVRYGANSKYRYFVFDYNNKKENVSVDVFKDKDRIFLTTIDEYDVRYNYDKKNGFLGSHKFIYSKSKDLPEYLSGKKDMWGYYTANADGTPNASDMLSGSLNTIIYPTGGRTVIDYEPHNYSQARAQLRQNMVYRTNIAGGLRVKSLTEYDKDNSKLKKRNFYYSSQKGGTSSGQLSAEPMSKWDWTTLNVAGGSVKVEMNSSSSLVPLCNSFGSHIGYSSVIEEIEGNGYTLYKYSNFSDVYDELPLYRISANVITNSINQIEPETKFTENQSKRGKLLSTQVYDNNNKLQKEIKYTYRTDNPNQNQYLLASNIKVNYGIGSAAGTYYTGNIYKIYYSRYDIEKEEVIDRRNIPHGNYTVSMTETKTYTRADTYYSLNDYNLSRVATARQLIEETSTDSNGNKIKKSYTYPYHEVRLPFIQELIANYRVNEPYFIRTFKGDIPIGATEIEYDQFHPDVIAPSRFSSSTTDLSASNLKVDLDIDKYDESGNIVSYKPYNKSAGIAIWGGVRKNVLLATIENESNLDNVMGLVNKTLIYDDISTKNDQLISEFNKLRGLLKEALITSYTYYENDKIRSVTAPSGITTYYNYDTFRRLSSIETNNKDTISTYSYKFAETNYEPHFVIEHKADSIDSSGMPIFNYLKPIAFNVVSFGSHDQFRYSWFIMKKNGSVFADVEKMESSQNNPISHNLKVTGEMLLSCSVKDLYTNKTHQVSQPFYIAYYPLKVNFSVGNYKIGQTISSYAITENGSGEFNYRWSLESPTGQVISTQTNQGFSWNINRTDLDQVILRCVITDRITGRVVEKKQTIYIYDRPCKFVNVKTDKTNYISGEIELPYKSKGDILIVRIFNRISTGKRYIQIGGYYHEASPYENKYIEVPLSGYQNSISFYFHCDKGPAEIELIGFKNNSGEVDQSNKYLGIQ